MFVRFYKHDTSITVSIGISSDFCVLIGLWFSFRACCKAFRLSSANVPILISFFKTICIFCFVDTKSYAVFDNFVLQLPEHIDIRFFVWCDNNQGIGY